MQQRLETSVFAPRQTYFLSSLPHFEMTRSRKSLECFSRLVAYVPLIFLGRTTAFKKNPITISDTGNFEPGISGID